MPPLVESHSWGGGLPDRPEQSEDPSPIVCALFVLCGLGAAFLCYLMLAHIANSSFAIYP
jgi:hypothetical protein